MSKVYYLTKFVYGGNDKIFMNPCTVSVPTEAALAAMLRGDTEYDNDLPLWEVQEKFDPKIGYSVVFHACRRTEGWWKTSAVLGWRVLDDGIIEFKTKNSTYYLEEHKE